VPKYKEIVNDIRDGIPSLFTALRLFSVPILFILIIDKLLFFGALLFLTAILTDFLDGYLSRRLEVSSKFGAYFDSATDFTFVFALFVGFITRGFCPFWILIVIMAMFVQFLITSQYAGRSYDPIGKYYGSLLYGVLGLRFIFEGQSFYNVVTVGITLGAIVSISSRFRFVAGSLREKITLRET